MSEMPKLSSKDFYRLSNFLVEIYRLGTHNEWVNHLLPSLHTLIPSDRASYNEMRYGKTNHISVKTYPDDSALRRPLVPVFEQYTHEHPSASYVRKTGLRPALRWSDVQDPKDFEKTTLYNEYFRHFDTRHQLAVALSMSPSLLVPVALNRGSRDFSDRETLMLNLLRPHLIQSFRNSRTLTALKSRSRALEHAMDELNRGLLEFTRRHTIRWASPQALRWLSVYWPGEATGDQLPPSLTEWIKQQEASFKNNKAIPVPQSPLSVDQGQRRVLVRLLREGQQRFLFFEERTDGPSPEDLVQLGLGHRESEVLAWVSRGKTNEEIASIMGLSIKTVKKHLERIFDKLGVESRTAAARMALGLSGN
ncbi:response regulator transcription factor [Nitrospira moscoviensis]|nr:helix-turn-helix transcriptional regulator [Nitrospira moscoviensis]